MALQAVRSVSCGRIDRLQLIVSSMGDEDREDDLMEYPYYEIDPQACDFYGDLSHCPKVKVYGDCPKTCDAMVKINSLKEELDFDDYLDGLFEVDEDES